MLATIGFGITGILFIIFAYAINGLATKKVKPVFDQYAQAYGLMAVAFIIWSVASAINSHSFLALSVVIGDILLYFATLLIVNIFFAASPNRKMWLYAAALAGLAALVVRTIYFYPKPYMTDQVLFFNSQRAVSFTISSVLLLIWLPVNLRIARQLTLRAPSMTRTYTVLYAAATLSAAIFLLSKATLTLALSFSALSVSFLMLIISCQYIKLLEEKGHGKRHAKAK